MTKWFTSISAYKLETEATGPESPPAGVSIEPDSSSFDTYDEFDDGVEDDVF